MAKKNIFADSKADMNMTPMIDVTFQLIIFFMLSGQSASDELDLRIALSRPKVSQALNDQAVNKAGNHVIVNVVSEDSAMKYKGQAVPSYLRGRVEYYMIRMPSRQSNLRKQEIKPDNAVAMMVPMLEDRKNAARAADKPEKDFTMVVRADKRTRWSDVEPVIMAGLGARIPKMNITALPKRGSE
ncbi:MAG: biopolymer transporter ExbD [Planctomycetaceae bacterium]|nr:biopolymer transporter ExbD [Planctomycetaceae bacterium]